MDYVELGHLGDGVYLSHDGHMFWLAVNDHKNKVVALEYGVLNNLDITARAYLTELVRRSEQ